MLGQSTAIGLSPSSVIYCFVRANWVLYPDYCGRGVGRIQDVAALVGERIADERPVRDG